MVSCPTILPCACVGGLIDAVASGGWSLSIMQHTALYQNCKNCQSRHIKQLYVSRGWGLPIIKCNTCGLVFVGKWFDSSDQEALYSQHNSYQVFASARRSVPEARRRVIIEWIKSYCNPSHFVQAAKRKPKLLDIGCGVGDLLVAARGLGFDVQGFEISDAAVRLAAQWNNLKSFHHVTQRRQCF